MSRHDLSILLAVIASARTADASPKGHIPYVAAGGFAGLALGSEEDTGYLAYAAGVGVEGELRLDLARALVLVDGFAAVGGVSAGVRTHVLLGRRSSSTVTDVVGFEVRGDGSTKTTYRSRDLRVPLHYGFLLGASTTLADRGDTTSIDAGFGLVGAQLQIVAAPVFSLNDGALGFRWMFGYAATLGDRLLYFRFAGDHPGGGGYGSLLSLSVGFTSSMTRGL